MPRIVIARIVGYLPHDETASKIGKEAIAEVEFLLRELGKAPTHESIQRTAKEIALVVADWFQNQGFPEGGPVSLEGIPGYLVRELANRLRKMGCIPLHPVGGRRRYITHFADHGAFPTKP